MSWHLVIPLLKFLVVDDVPDNRFLVAKSLLKQFPGSIVQECEESTPAIAAVQHDRLSAIIVHRGRDVDGPTMVALLRRVNPSVPIIMVSGRESCPAAIEAGANAFLNYESWQRIGAVVDHTLAAERERARESKFPFIAVPAKNAAAAGAEGRPRILYLEDDPADVELLRERLRDEKIPAEIEHVSTPKEFAEALQRTAPKLVLADGNVAGFVTTAALNRVRQQWPVVPFYCLSGVVTDEKQAVLRASGATGCLSKQDFSAVSRVVRRTLETEG